MRLTPLDIQNHLGELIATLVRWYGIDEVLLWRSVGETCRCVFRVLKQDPATAENAADDEEALFRPTLSLKAMTTMRLAGGVTCYHYSEVPNPLAEFVDG